MNSKRFLLLVLVLSQAIVLIGQSVQFSYDANGNRITRTIEVEQLLSSPLSFPVPPESLKSAGTKGELSFHSENIQSDNLRDSLSDILEIKTLVFPNPTNGLLKVDVLNKPVDSHYEIKVYDLSGTELIVKRNSDGFSEVDISRLKDGIYILRISIKEKSFDWKIIKSSY